MNVGVCCAASARSIAVPMFFNETINYEKYVQAVLGQFFPQLTEEERPCGWLQQDSATAHTVSMSMQDFSYVFGKRIISSRIWPARSPDLSPCDFYF
jgi:hypothetical protein